MIVFLFFRYTIFYPYLQVNIDQMLAVAKKAEENAEKQAKTQMDMMKELEKQAQSQVRKLLVKSMT